MLVHYKLMILPTCLPHTTANRSYFVHFKIYALQMKVPLNVILLQITVKTTAWESVCSNGTINTVL